MELEHLERLVRVLEFDPDLGAALDDVERPGASAAAVAPVARLTPGSWSAPERAERGHMGFLILDGMLTRTTHVDGRRSVELLAAGDVLRPWVSLGPDAPADVSGDWSVMEKASLAVLDAAFARRVSRWPEIACALLDRLVMRTRWLALDLAVCHVRRVDDRLMLLFWQLARRWGRVTPVGVVIPLNLQHQLLAALIGAQRPSVTTRLGVLRDRGLLQRRADGTWLLPSGNNGVNVLEELDALEPALALA